MEDDLAAAMAMSLEPVRSKKHVLGAMQFQSCFVSSLICKSSVQELNRRLHACSSQVLAEGSSVLSRPHRLVSRTLQAAGHPDPGPAAAAVATLQANAAVLAEAGSVSILSTLLNNLASRLQSQWCPLRPLSGRVVIVWSCGGSVLPEAPHEVTNGSSNEDSPTKRNPAEVKNPAEDRLCWG